MSDFTPLHHKLARDIVEDSILKGVKPGTHLVATLFAKQFQISRTPILRAMDLLVKLQVLEKVNNRGYFVRELNKFDRDDAQSEEERLYWNVVNDIYDEHLPESFDETILINRYGISRRKSSRLLTRLSDEGVLRKRAGIGWKVELILKTHHDIEQSLRYRLALELTALSDPHFFAPANEVSDLTYEQEQILEGGILTPQSVQSFERNARFHETIVKWSNNIFFFDAIVQHNKLRRLWEYRHFTTPIDVKRSTEEHLSILARIEVGDIEAAQQLLHVHLSSRLEEQIGENEL